MRTIPLLPSSVCTDKTPPLQRPPPAQLRGGRSFDERVPPRRQRGTRSASLPLEPPSRPRTASRGCPPRTMKNFGPRRASRMTPRRRVTRKSGSASLRPCWTRRDREGTMRWWTSGAGPHELNAAKFLALNVLQQLPARSFATRGRETSGFRDQLHLPPTLCMSVSTLTSTFAHAALLLRSGLVPRNRLFGSRPGSFADGDCDVICILQLLLSRLYTGVSAQLICERVQLGAAIRAASRGDGPPARVFLPEDLLALVLNSSTRTCKTTDALSLSPENPLQSLRRVVSSE